MADGLERGRKTTKQINVLPQVIATTAMNTVAFWSWDNVNWVSQLLLVIFAGIALVSGTIVNRRQSSVIASANERAAKLEKQTAEAKLELERVKLSRYDRLNRDAFREAIRGKPKMRVELLFQKDDAESYMFASAVKWCLNAEGWTTIGPRPIREDDVSFSELHKDAPLSVRAGLGFGGFAFVVKNLNPAASFNNPDAIWALGQAFTVGKRGFGVTQASTMYGTTGDPGLPDDLIKVIIGPRYQEW